MIRYKRFILIVLTTFLATLTIYGLTRETKSNIEFNEPLPMRNESVQSVDHLDYLNASINPLDGCYHVYLDVGTNVGIQVQRGVQCNVFYNSKSILISHCRFGNCMNLNYIQELNPINFSSLISSGRKRPFRVFVLSVLNLI